MENVYKVIGVIKRKYTEGKNEGKTACTYHLSGKFSDYDIKNADTDGEQVLKEFAYKDFGVKVGDYVNVVYVKGYQDKAQLDNMYPVKNPFEGKPKPEAK